MTLPITEIDRLIPQRDPFVMIDQLDDSDEISTRCSLTVRASNLLVADGQLTASGLIENMAQTAAARAGFLAMAENKPAPVGFIGDIKNLEILELPRIGDLLSTEIKILNQVFNVSMILGTVRKADMLLAQCEMKIIVKHET